MSPVAKEEPADEPEEGIGLQSATEVSGSWVISGIMVLGLAAAIFAWVFQHYQTDEALAFWGSDASQKIRLAEKVELLTLVPEGDSRAKETLTGSGYSIGVVSRRDISKAPGLTHARQALLQDASFRFDLPPADCAAPYTLALQFTSDDQSATLLFELDCPVVRDLESASEARLGERLAEGLKTFLGEHLGEKKKP